MLVNAVAAVTNVHTRQQFIRLLSECRPTHQKICWWKL